MTVDEALRAELVAMAAADQAFRRNFVGPLRGDAATEAMAAEHERARLIAEIVATEGWPVVSRVGDDGATAAWLLVQHADHDVEFQERALALLEGAVAAGEASARHAAYLTDRVCVNRGRPQIYGTQFFGSGETFGPRPIQDPAQLDERRAGVGLEPFAEYECHMRGVEGEHCARANQPEAS